MQTRHRIPTVFNLSVVDVLCCALGCVILLWLVNAREARRKAQAAGETSKQLALVQRDLAASKTERQQVQALLEQAQADRGRAQRLVLSTQGDLNQARADLQTAQADVSRLQGDLKKLQIVNNLLSIDLGKKSKELTGLDRRLSVMDGKVIEVQKQLREKSALLAAAGERVEDLASRLQDSRTRITGLEAQVSDLRVEEKSSMTKLAGEERDLGRLKKELGEVNNLYRKLLASQTALDRELLLRGKEVTEHRLTIADLEREKRALEDRIRIARQAADNRFAGVTLTGRKVVFLVDMSGSMDLIDEQTPAPDKWPLLCETLCKIMKSLPDLTHYQVILFSDHVSYPLGNRRRWLLFDRETSPKNVQETLRKVKAEGGTNMAAAFAETFEFRALGMDTVYVFSDGLPNMGEGLPAGGENLSESQKTVYCTRYVRQMLKDVWNRRIGGQPKVRINAIGFFFESPDVGAFLWAMAREHEGSFVGMSKP